MKKTLITASAFIIVAISTLGGSASAQAVDSQQTTPNPEPVLATVEKGDSLSKIATRYNTKWPRIYYANESIQNPDLINPGDQLRIPADSEDLTARPLSSPAPTPAQPTAKAAAPVQTVRKQPATATVQKPVVAKQTQASYPVSANEAKAFIYAKESGNNPNATNPNGCYGLGQDCNGVVRNQCGADYACQDAFFTNYAMKRYGSWENALAFWQSHHWW